MKRIKATKTNIEKLEHPTGKKPDRYFASNCSAGSEKNYLINLFLIKLFKGFSKSLKVK